MSDEQLREAERNYKREPTDENLLVWVYARRRMGEEDVEAFRVLKFAKNGSAWKLFVTTLDGDSLPTGNPLPCRNCGESGEGYECWSCAGTGIDSDYIDAIEMAEVNKFLDHIRARRIVGRWRRTPSKLLRWLGP